MSIKRFIIGLFIGCFIVSCGGSKKITQKTTDTRITTKKTPPEKTFPKENPDSKPETRPSTHKDNVSLYIDTYATIAKEEMMQYGVPASITLAQGILESGAGKGVLVKKANNHFGIKCHNWKGAKVYHDDDEKGECFRKYSLAKFSFRDHSLFLSNRGRYSDLFKLPKDDYKGWAKGLKAAGYATDKKYPAKLIALIERYKLYVYDGEVLGKDQKDYKKVVDKKDQHTVKKGENLYRIARKYNITVSDLKKFNGLEGDQIFEGQVLYIKPFDRGY